LTDASGEVTFAARYTPRGNTLEPYGDGNFAFGYFGGLTDEATGLLYIGNGQYYDPTAGRFLTRGANPNSTNPYVPWNGDPSGAFIAPLALLALLYRNKRKRGKWDILVIMLVLGLSLGLGLAACAPGTSTPPPPNPTAVPNPEPEPEQIPGGGQPTCQSLCRISSANESKETVTSKMTVSLCFAQFGFLELDSKYQAEDHQTDQGEQRRGHGACRGGLEGVHGEDKGDA